jgi:hypothetical protein
MLQEVLRARHTSDSVYEQVLATSPAPFVLELGGLDGNSIGTAVERYCPELASGGAPAYIAGGFIRDTLIGREPRDLDLYVSDADTATSIEARLRSGSWTLADCAPVVTTWRQHGRTVQVVRTEHQTPAACIARFDLTVCCAAYDLVTAESWSSAAFSADLVARQIVIHQPAFPIDTLRRIAGFVDQGYRIAGAELLKLHSLILDDIHAHKMKAYRFGEVA